MKFEIITGTLTLSDGSEINDVLIRERAANVYARGIQIAAIDRECAERLAAGIEALIRDNSTQDVEKV